MTVHVPAPRLCLGGEGNRVSVGRVVVAGAGVAGPSAAFRLSRAGARVTVLERAGRVGARRPVCAYAVGGTA
ncbi:hypothetical protein GCM10023321_27810 [Pseudonocardia eucalypti]|uniref:FAD dependent oxidoreductase domain-containing protein n=1 Tax=Pseudonocardia eucalypti TaxID=648755 RepID=A0ABP9Q0W8_9PSEU